MEKLFRILRNNRLILYSYLFFSSLWVYGQDSIPKNFSVSGYITNMQSFMFQHWDSAWASDNLIHNRLNFQWHNDANSLGAVFEMRNRFLTGESVRSIPGYAKMIDNDEGLVKLSNNVAKGKSYILNLKIDRMYIDLTQHKIQLRLGRQRINWGQNFVWNPNDLFNTYSFFDFDYIEKPGSDAFRLQYYTNSTSAFEVAVKANSDRKTTSAALYRFNKWNYDIQFLGGLLNEEDYVVGCGWSGNIKGAAFTGEISYFHPKNNFTDTTGVIAIALGSNYTFSNSFMLQYEFLYNRNKNSGIRSFNDYYTTALSPKNLSITEITMMLQGSYPISPLFNASLSIMYFPKIRGFFIGPSLSYSMADNVDFSLIVQSFSGQISKRQTEYYHLGFLRLKWNF